MQLPQRHPNHILESESWKLLQAAIPSHWILRQVTEQDYGIDAYLELVTNDGFVTGHLVSLQLKRTDVKWKNGVFRFPGIRKETINYWMNLPVPVFLCVADKADGRVYFLPVKDFVRKSFAAIAKQKTLTFQFEQQSTLNNNNGLRRFLVEFARERRHQQCSLDLTTLLANCTQYAEFCRVRQLRDVHLDVEPHDLLVFVHLHGVARSVAVHLGIEWDLKDVQSLLAEDLKQWKEPEFYLHEGTAGRFVKEFAPKLATIIETARNHVSGEYSDYWRSQNPLLWESCQEYNEYRYVIELALETLRSPY